MNERYLVIGMNKDNEGYYAMWLNESIICGGATPEDAISNLLVEQYPGIWAVNEIQPMAEEYIETEAGPLGRCPVWVKRETQDGELDAKPEGGA